jgi:hypothetical protein
MPPTVAAIILPIVGGFYLGGPGLGMAVGALAAATIIVLAVRKPPLAPIAPPPPRDSRRHLLVVLDCPLEGGTGLDALAQLAHGDGEERQAELLLLSPCRNRFLDRWASDLEPGRHQAQRNLVLSAAALAAAEIEATARAGDEDLVQMVDDALRAFPATGVVVATEDPEEQSLSRALGELRSRLRVPMVVLRPGPAPTQPQAAALR